ncbi:hypothetical protein N186_03985 [Thermofilum adornatum]|uniref:PIN domain-containing protein n=1 Tax=Thermofilum adornatum TaxID=1365176 RepID=S5ZKR6_9CREN|nr:type II toxin-antitoxin system VapC family toxin [Thermofilum adornatum]AGT35156.1 hypothetical protein N186_03985 [Thermofilum adornatum]
METVVIDASVAVKWFVEEHGTQKALELRDRYIDGELKLIAPQLFPYEVLNVLRYKHLFTIDELKTIGEALEAYSIDLYPLVGKLRDTTIQTAHENNITIYDASYIALAIIKNTTLYTADKKLKNKLTPQLRQLVKTLDEI